MDNSWLRVKLSLQSPLNSGPGRRKGLIVHLMAVYPPPRPLISPRAHNYYTQTQTNNNKSASEGIYSQLREREALHVEVANLKVSILKVCL